jgi:ABC-type sugar transport system ATPase subunit
VTSDASAPPASRLTVTGIAKSFGATRALVGVDLTVNASRSSARTAPASRH